jgi:hypothetical protein
MASQLLSHSTATALIRNLKSNEAQQLSQFIEIVNSWFDIMNSNNLNESIATKKNITVWKNKMKYLIKWQRISAGLSKGRYYVYKIVKSFISERARIVWGRIFVNNKSKPGRT